MRRTKIICTMGPSTNSYDMMLQLISAGMNVARFNFSHDEYSGHLKRLEMLRKASAELGIPIAALMDTKGPEIRIGKFKDGKVELKKGEMFMLTTEEIEGDENKVSVSFKDLPDDVGIGSTILLDDGLVELCVVAKTPTSVTCEVVNGGAISNNKGVNVPNVSLSIPYLSEKDKSDIMFAAENDYDFIAASFTRTADDIVQIKALLEKVGCTSMKIIAKIENRQGIDNIDEILRVSDGIMIARGDLGVEIPFEELPALQKRMIKKGYNAGKIVITATQMLDSMISHPRPTRAETTDVANAIYDGTSAIMLSGETAAGKYPIEALKTMVSIARRTERDIDYEKRFRNIDSSSAVDVTSAISHAACTTAYDLGAKAIFAVTQTGGTARMMSKYRPNIPIIGCTPSKKVLRQLTISWGVVPMLVENAQNSDELFEMVVATAFERGLIEQGDLVVITGGVPVGVSGTTNMLKVHLAGNVLMKGTGVNSLSGCGRLCIAMTDEEAKSKFQDGDILVMPRTSKNILSLIKRSSGIIAEEAGDESHAAIIGTAIDIPVIVGAYNATNVLKNGTTIKIDAQKGFISTTDN